MSGNRDGGCAGFTLLEVMIGLAILAGVIVTVLGSLSYHLGVLAEGRDRVTAAVLGREKSEEAALFGMPKEVGGGFEDESLKRYTWAFTSADTEIEGLRRAEISVRWDGVNDVTFISYYGEK